jgi:hypothetical protein
LPYRRLNTHAWVPSTVAGGSIVIDDVLVSDLPDAIDGQRKRAFRRPRFVPLAS